MKESKTTYQESLVEVNEVQSSVALAFGFSKEEVAVIQHSVAKKTTKVELAYFLNVCKTMELNPFNKEVWCYKDNKGNLLIFAGRDGFLSKAQRNPLFNGIRSCEVREKDDWKIDIANGKIEHSIWKSHPSEMIKKVSETHALKKAFGISGIQSEYEFNVDNGVATPINQEVEKSVQQRKNELNKTTIIQDLP